MKFFIPKDYLAVPSVELLVVAEGGKVGLVVDASEIGTLIKAGRVYPSVLTNHALLEVNNERKIIH